MALFSSSKYPKTAKYEAKRQQLREDADRFNKYQDSEELKRIKELELLTNSKEFKAKAEKLKKERFKDTSEYRQLSKFTALKKSSEFKKYFKYVAAGQPNKVKSIENSDKRAELITLSEYIRSSEFAGEKSKKGYKKTDAFEKFKRHKALSKDADIRFYNKQINSSAYKNYLNINDSERLKNYNELEAEVTSEKFLEFKRWMEDKKKFEKSEEYSLIQEYNKLLKSPDYLWYKKHESNNHFSELNKWELAFEDDFNTKNLSSDKWITGYYWGKALLNKTYVLENEQQFFKDENISIGGNGIKLATKQEQTEGIVWDTKRGFMPKTFDYSSALISTGQSHRQLYGKFEAKVKIDHASPVNHAFWMVGEKMAPQIDIFRFEDSNAKSVNMGLQLLDNSGVKKQCKTVKGASFDSDYYVYSMEWSKDKITWFINGVKVNEQNSNIPKDPMYLVFSSHITQEMDALKKPANINIEWIKCYHSKN